MNEIKINETMKYNVCNVNLSFPMIGAHSSVEKTLYETLEKAIAYGMYSCQFFLGSPQSFTRKAIDDHDIEKCQKLLKRFPTYVFSHAPYTINLAGSVDGNDMSKLPLCISALEHELNIMGKLGGGVVLHPGVSKNKEMGLKKVAESISSIQFEDGQCLLLEVMAGQGNSLGSTFEELRQIYDEVEDSKKKFIGFCIDTAHVWGKGLYRLNQVDEVEKMFKDMDRILGKERIKLIHFNDSSVQCGSHVDRHQLIAEGEIWKDESSKDALMKLLQICITRRIPCVLETHGRDMIKFYQ